MKTCDKCGGSGVLVEPQDVEMLASMILFVATQFPMYLPLWETEGLEG